jgi:hypothetical protein
MSMELAGFRVSGLITTLAISSVVLYLNFGSHHYHSFTKSHLTSTLWKENGLTKTRCGYMFQDFDKTHHCCARPTDIQEVK